MSRSADSPGTDPGQRVYSAAIVPSLDRIVTTTTDMHADSPASRNLQVWSLQDLELLHTFPLPDGPAGNEGLLTAEPRLLDDGRTVLVSTFRCGLYLMQGLESESPSARLVASFPQKPETYCAIPVISGHYYLVTVPAWNAVVSLDIRNPAAPREVSRLTLGANDVPHWIAISPDHRRVVVTGYEGLQHRVVIARFDSTTGELTLDYALSRGRRQPSPAFAWTTRPGRMAATPRAFRTVPCSAGRSGGRPQALDQQPAQQRSCATPSGASIANTTQPPNTGFATAIICDTHARIPRPASQRGTSRKR